MRRVTFRNGRGGMLVGHLHESPSTKCVVMAHGFTGDKSMKGRFDQIGEALLAAGYTALAFDFSGCGESDDDLIDPINRADDLRSAIAFARSLGCSVALFGQSLGSLDCLRCYDPGIATMVLLAAATGPMHYDWTLYYSEEQLGDLKAHGRLLAKVPGRWRDAAVISKRMLDDFALIRQPALLSPVKCPVLLINGNSPSDKEELALLENSRRALAYLPQGSRLEIVDGADHRFTSHLGEAIARILPWLAAHF